MKRRVGEEEDYFPRKKKEGVPRGKGEGGGRDRWQVAGDGGGGVRVTGLGLVG